MLKSSPENKYLHFVLTNIFAYYKMQVITRN